MKLFLPLLLLLTIAPASGALAHWDDDDDAPNFHASCCDHPARWADRHDVRDARIAVDTRDRDVTLVLTEKVVAIQLSDRTMREVTRKLRDEAEDDEDDDSVLARTIKTVVLSTVRGLLDHSIECRVRDIRDVEYRHGRLVFTTEDGDRIFDDIKVNDEDVMRSYSERDARRFVSEFRKVKARGR